MSSAETSELKLDPSLVEKIYEDCGGYDPYVAEHPVKVEGVMHKANFIPAQLEQHRAAIEALVCQLPDQFMASGGGGWTFLNACDDKHGNQWTGFHDRMEQLLMLGMAIGKVECQFPRALWPHLPGRMPHYVVNDVEVGADQAIEFVNVDDDTPDNRVLVKLVRQIAKDRNSSEEKEASRLGLELPALKPASS